MRKAKVSPIILAATCVVLIQGSIGARPFDDAFITFRYARNLLSGAGFVYNAGQRVLGTTTPLYTLILALLAWPFGAARLPTVALAVAVAADALNVWLMYRLARRLLGDRRVALLVSAVFLLHPFRLDIASGGMETSLFITTLLLLYDRYYAGPRPGVIALLTAASVLVRPDAVLALIPLYGHWLWNDRRGAARGAALSLLFTAPWLLWATDYFGNPIPHSLLAKGAVYNPPGAAAFFILTFLATGAPGPYPAHLPLTLLGATVHLALIARGIVAAARNRPEALPVVAYPPLYCLTMAVLNRPMFYSWYFAPLIPGLILLLMGNVWRWNPPDDGRVRWGGCVALCAAALALPLALMTFRPTWPLSREREIAFREAAWRIRDELAEGAWVLAPDIGVIGWELEQANILDVAGLVSPEAFPYMQPGLAIAPEMVADLQPDYIIAQEQFVGPRLLADDGFQDAYTLVWRGDAEIVGVAQPVYVFQRRE